MGEVHEPLEDDDIGLAGGIDLDPELGALVDDQRVGGLDGEPLGPAVDVGGDPAADGEDAHARQDAQVGGPFEGDLGSGVEHELERP